MKASSEAARTSRVSAPIASPSAAKASAPTAPARRARAGSGPSRGPRTGRGRPASAGRPTSEQTAASPAFSTSRPVRDTSPRTSRENAFSSRSSASVPAASSSVMNISETATASATANDAERGGAAVERRAPSTLIGSPTDGQHVVREVEVLARELAKAITWSSCVALAASPGGSSARASRRIASERSRPSTSKSWPEEAVLAALRDQVEQLERLLRDPLRERARWPSAPAT